MPEGETDLIEKAILLTRERAQTWCQLVDYSRFFSALAGFLALAPLPLFVDLPALAVFRDPEVAFFLVDGVTVDLALALADFAFD